MNTNHNDEDKVCLNMRRLSTKHTVAYEQEKQRYWTQLESLYKRTVCSDKPVFGSKAALV